MGKPILCLDFDGTLHSYKSGWQGADVIPDAPVDGAIEFLVQAVEKFRVNIYSSRSHQPFGIEAMKLWTQVNLLKTLNDPALAGHIYEQIEWPTHKPAAMISIDDRAMRFTGVWPSIDELLSFKPWNK